MRKRKRRHIPTELTWEEKNPTDYIYRPSEAMLRLRKEFKKKKSKNGKS